MNFDGINWDSVESQIDNFGNKPPFDYVVIDDFFKKEFAETLSNEFPSYDSETWHGYDNPIEVKKFVTIGTFFQKTHIQLFLTSTLKNGLNT